MNTINRGTKSHTTGLAAIIFLSLLTSWIATPSWSGATTYYVSPSGSDSNPGTQVSPWLTIQKAANMMVAGDTAIVTDGTYVSSGSISFNTSGTVTQPITLKAQNKWGAILSTAPGCLPQISLLASYIVLDGLRLRLDPSNVPCSPTTAVSSNGVMAWIPGTDPEPTPSRPWTTWHHATIRNCWIEQGTRGDGIKSQQDYTLVENSTVYNGIEIFNNFGSIVRNNTVYGPDIGNSNMVVKGGSRNYQAYNNLIYMTGTNWIGLWMGGGGGSTTGYLYSWGRETNDFTEVYNSVAYNNVIINQTGNPSVRALGFAGAKDCALFNNVVIDGSLFLYRDTYVNIPSVNPTWKNNIIAGSGAAATTGFDSTTGADTAIIDYNNFYNVTGIPSQVHAITGDPLFVNRLSDWHLQAGSPALGSGIALTLTGYNGELIPVNQDKVGTVRTVPWSLGIYATSGPPATTMPASPTNLRVQ